MPKSKNRKKKKGRSCTHVKTEMKIILPIKKGRKRFLLDKFHLICKSAGSPDSIRLFTIHDLKYFQLDLNKPFHLLFYEKENKIDNDFKKFIRFAIQDYLETQMISYKEGATEISLWDHLIYGETLAYLFRSKNGYKLTFRKTLMEELHHFETYVNTDNKINETLKEAFRNISVYISTPDIGLFELVLDYCCDKEKRPSELQTRFNNYRYCMVSLTKAKKKRLITNQGPRLGYCLIAFLSEGGPVFFSTVFSLPKFNVTNLKLHDVYISDHALTRMEERLDCLDIRKALIFVGVSMMRFVAESKKDFRKNRRFPYYFYNTILGYFIYEIVGDDMFIRTFLFITNEGTPEGNALTKKLGLSKYDKMFWNLGKLSTFFKSDIYSNPDMKELLEECNCDHIPEVEEFIQIEDEKQYTVANKILDYMKKQKTEVEEFDEYLEYQ